jgi:S1-C subfamily serine protease
MKRAYVSAWRAIFLLAFAATQAQAEEGIADTVEKIKPSIVGVGTYQRTRTPPLDFRGTGFIVGDGLHVLTNAHVLPASINKAKFETLAVLVRENGKETLRGAEIVEQDEPHDVALLKIAGPPLPAMALGNSDKVREGEIYAFTGYPIGVVLGLHPATHRGMVSAITPSAIPAPRAGQLNSAVIGRLQDPYLIFQLDATAYPGNSGSPLYDTKTGHVVGIINKVFVQETKENILSKPSGISYAIPIRYADQLLKKNSRKTD